MTPCQTLRERHFIFATSGFFQNEKEEKEKNKKWVRELFGIREEKEALNNLIQKMKLTNRESFFREDLIRLVNIDLCVIYLISLIHSSTC